MNTWKDTLANELDELVELKAISDECFERILSICESIIETEINKKIICVNAHQK